MFNKLSYILPQFFLLLTLLGCRSLDSSPPAGDSTLTIVKRIYANYGVEIYYIYDEVSFFSEGWLEEPVNGRGRQIEEQEFNRIVPLIEQFLSSYDLKFIRANLEAIYLTSELSFYGKKYGGTYSSNGIYINNSGKEDGYTDNYLLSTMHHEFSSIILRNYHARFPEERWLTLNEEGFNYSGTGVEVLGQSGLFSQSKELWEQGFLIEYSKSSLENDFNVFAEWLFIDEVRLKELASQNDRINKKYQIILSFYEEIMAFR